MPVPSLINLQPQAYGTTPAAELLVSAVRERGTTSHHRQIVAVLTRIRAGFEEMLKMDNPIRDDAMRWWVDRVLDENHTLVRNFEQLGMPYSVLRNICTTMLAQMMGHGAVLERLRDRGDHDEIIRELRKITRKAGG